MKIVFESGSAYDFFVSLIVLHKPDDFGVRLAWAAGMRQRLTPNHRKTLESLVNDFMPFPPLHWLHGLDSPKNASMALKTLAALPGLSILQILAKVNPEFIQHISPVIQEGHWEKADLQNLRAYYQNAFEKNPSERKLRQTLQKWSNAVQWLESLLPALQNYYDVFFAQEETRIIPVFEDQLFEAKKSAEKLTPYQLIEKLTHGIRFEAEALAKIDTLILIPSFWSSPLSFYKYGPETILLYGARPDTESLIPGAPVPDHLMRILDAIDDETRLRILRILTNETLTPTLLATRLRLRTPTVAHHLKILRTAGLVLITPTKSKKEIYYQTRTEGLSKIPTLINQFINTKETKF